MSLHEATNIEPLVKRITVPASPERAFEVFTTEMTAWWPLAGFSIGGEQARRIEFGSAVGDRITEYGEGGPIGPWSRSAGTRATTRRRPRTSPWRSTPSRMAPR